MLVSKIHFTFFNNWQSKTGPDEIYHCYKALLILPYIPVACKEAVNSSLLISASVCAFYIIFYAIKLTFGL